MQIGKATTMPSLTGAGSKHQDQADSPVKKLRTDSPGGRDDDADISCSSPNKDQYELLWVIKNRPDYHPPLLRQPYGVTLGEEVILTTEGLWPHSRIQVFDRGGRSKRVIGQGQILPFGVTLNSDNQVVVTDHKARTVKGYSMQGQSLFSWDTGKFEWPNGIAVTRNGLYTIADWSKGMVYICDGNGDNHHCFSTVSDSKTLSCPDYIAVDSHDRIIISDAYSCTVKIFNQSGDFLFEIGHQQGPGNITAPKGVATDNKNNIIVTDWVEGCIKLYDANGLWIKDLITEANDLKHPLAMATNPSGSSILVTEHKLNGHPTMKMFSRG